MNNIEPYRNSFAAEAMREGHPHWDVCTQRLLAEQRKPNEIRSEFDRDGDRILHSLAYSRLKSKTQVFFHTQDDRICTRIEHVNHVNSISGTIARFLGLNAELTQAIAMGHDLGHAPFGHRGETVLDDLCQEHNLGEFWHEQNSLRVADHLELLSSPDGTRRHLNLSYAVRDGIIAHCGEVNQQCLRTRGEKIDLQLFSKHRRFDPYTWEGCVVKLSDKMAYLGRDLEDAERIGLVSPKQIEDLQKEVARFHPLKAVNNTNLIHTFIIDLCRNSSPENGLQFSAECYELMKTVMKFNYEHIYKHPRLRHYDAYAKLVLSSLFEVLSEAAHAADLAELADLNDGLRRKIGCYPRLHQDFAAWLDRMSSTFVDERAYRRAIIDFLSTLTDRGVLEYYNELITF